MNLSKPFPILCLKQTISMRTNLKEFPSIKEAYAEFERLDRLFYKTFNKNPETQLFVWSAGDPKLNPTHGITIEWKKESEKEFNWFEQNVGRTE